MGALKELHVAVLFGVALLANEVSSVRKNSLLMVSENVLEANASKITKEVLPRLSEILARAKSEMRSLLRFRMLGVYWCRGMLIL